MNVPPPAPEPSAAPRPAAPKPGKLKVPVARKARPDSDVPDIEASPLDEAMPPWWSPWEWRGWGWSLFGHSVFLVVLGLWISRTPSTKVPTFDSSLGTPRGSDLGMTTLGGLDAARTPPETLRPPAESPVTLRTLQTAELADPLAGLIGNTGNPGAGMGDGFGLARFGNGNESVQGVQVKVGDPQFTLIWDSNADIDLHVIEPGGAEIYWNHTRGRFGGELDVDNTVGHGPENIYWLREKPDGSRELGPGPPGEYRWSVLYYGGNNGRTTSTQWTVRVKHEGRVEKFQGRLNNVGARSPTYTLKVGNGEAPTSPFTVPDR